MTSGEAIRAIALYLPQFHPIPENDRWWGPGFTEWTNVRKAAPRFPGHYQPHVPGAMGYYDLREPAARAAQAALAREYGIHGFCYYHYWFNGMRLLETPLNEVLRTREPDFPFCVCWANENWTRRWDGCASQVLVSQTYSDEDSVAFIRALVPTFQDERYIRVNGKPLFLVYRTGLLPDPKRMAEIWREELRRAGVGDLYLVRVETGLHGVEPRPDELGFDAAMEFAPHWQRIGPQLHEFGGEAVAPDVRIHDYRTTVQNMMGRALPSYTLFRGVFPSWDNTARRRVGPTVFAHASPELYAYWLSVVSAQTLRHRAGDERLVFINAWNEWAEGCHLEPDEKHGAAYLEATARVLRQASELERVIPRAGKTWLNGDPTPLRRWYEALVRSQQDGVLPSPEILRFLAANANLLGLDGALLDELLRSLDTAARERADALRRERDDALARIQRIQSTFAWRFDRRLRRMRDRLRGRKPGEPL
jgi:lipopolysaccharide biosynthesis protein